MVRLLLIAWLVSLLGCAAAPHVVRFRAASGATWTYRPSSRAQPIRISEAHFQGAVRSSAHNLPSWGRPLDDARRFFDIPERSGVYLYEVRTHRLIPESADSPMDEVSNEKWVADYEAWCARTRLGTGDCLGILLDGHLTSHGRYVLALWISRSEVLMAAVEAARETGRPKAVLATLAGATGMYFMLWALPEPFSKGVAAVITIGLIGYLGFDTVLELGTAFDRMVRESDQARDFAELSAAGQRFGKVFGQNAARALIALTAAAIGRTGGTLVEKLSSLPVAGPMFQAVLAQVGIDMAAVGEIEAVVVSPATISVSLASGSVVAMAVGGKPGGSSATVINPNKLNHIFGKAEHGLDDFVKACGGREQAFMRIQEAANAALREGRITPGPNGVLPGGDAGPIIDVAGTQIRLIGGRVIGDVVEIGTVSRRGLP